MAGLGSGRSDPGHSSPDKAEKARVAARQSAAWLRDEAAQLYDNYTKQSKYFKWRSWIVGGNQFTYSGFQRPQSVGLPSTSTR